ncbi:hypothetical protein DER44DRAFT_754017 [Fusarium oxysporum]|nr:hypothetical protein DER44DRAFT_754017 [Fusarium oxysporum]
MEGIGQLNEQHQMLLCRLCKVAIEPGARIEWHFRGEHQLKGRVLKDIKYYYGSMELADPKFAALPEDNSPAIKLLTILDGYSCVACRHLTVARDNIVRHWPNTAPRRFDGPRCGYRRGWEEESTHATGSFETAVT